MNVFVIFLALQQIIAAAVINHAEQQAKKEFDQSVVKQHHRIKLYEAQLVKSWEDR